MIHTPALHRAEMRNYYSPKIQNYESSHKIPSVALHPAFSLEALTLATAIATLCEVEKHHRQAKEAHKERRHLL